MARVANQLLLVANPSASRVSDRVLLGVERALRERLSVEVVRTVAEGQATTLARRAAAEGWPAVAVLGGDGTQSEAADGLAGTATALAPLPGGMTNVLCRTLGQPQDPVEAARRLTGDGERAERRVDLGTMNGRHFLFAAGVGATAELMERAGRRPRLKGVLRQQAFAFAGASLLTERERPRLPGMRVEVGPEVVEAVTVVVQNSSPLTYLAGRPIVVCEGAGLTSGSLGLALARRADPRDVAGVLGHLVRGALRGVPGAVLAHRQVAGFAGVAAARVVAHDGRAVAVELDGTFVGRLEEVRFGVAPGALRVLA